MRDTRALLGLSRLAYAGSRSVLDYDRSAQLAYFLAINLIRFLVAARSRLAFDKNVPYRAAAHRRGMSDWDRHL